MAGRTTPGATGVAAAAALLVFAVVGAAVAAPWRMQQRDWSSWGGFDRHGTPPSPPVASVRPLPPSTTRQQPTDLSWVGPVLLTLGALAAALGAWWLWRRYRRSAVTRQEQPRGTGLLAVVTEAPEVPVLRRGVAAAQRHLDEIADPSDAVVAAWLALEEAAASSGVGRRPAETPTEFTVAVLAATRADPGATRDLLALYHRARFSTTPLSRADVSVAGRCLGALAASWEAMTQARVTAAIEGAAPGRAG